jgi:hypothetical protein
MNRDQELRIYMKAARAKFNDGNGRHLSQDEMIAYCREPMAAAEREEARLHILQCDHCLQLFRDVSDFFEPRREDEEEIDQLQISRAWNDFWPRARTERKVASRIVESVRRSFPRAAWQLAAGLLITLGLATVFVWRERQERLQAQLQIAQLQNRQQDLEARLSQGERTAGNQLEQERERRAEAEAQVKELQIRLNGLGQSQQNIPVYSIGSATRGQQEASDVSIPRTTRTFILSMDVYNPYEFPEYVVEIFDQHGQRVKEISGLRPVGMGKTLNLTLHRGSLKEGKYLIKLSGRRGGTNKKLEEYSLLLSFSR